MDEPEAKKRYEQAKRLYQAKRPAEALAILDEVDKAFPRDKNIMFARALALTDLGQRNAALELCEYLVAVYADPRGERLKAQLCPQPASADQVQRGGGRRLLLGFGVVVVLLILAILAYWML